VKEKGTNFVSGLPETHCGIGSTVRKTEIVRRLLPSVLEKFNIRILVDAPCGDYNWLKETDLSMLDSYVGLDISERNINQSYVNLYTQPTSKRPSHIVFKKFDALSDELPRSDAVMTRDFFQHLPLAVGKAYLDKIIASGAKYLIATSYSNQVNKDIKEIGDFRHVNLFLPPFLLPMQLSTIVESTVHSLVVCQIND